MNIFVFAIIGISVFTAIVFGIFMSQINSQEPVLPISKPEHYSIEITGLKEKYLVGEPYSFSYILSGFGDSCGGIMVTYPINKTNNAGVGSVGSCGTITPKDFVWDTKSQGTSFGHISLQEVGNYTVKIAFSKRVNQTITTEKSFTVVYPDSEKNCNLLGFADVGCFVDSFNDCTPAIFQDTRNTGEGDPITIVAKIQTNSNQTGCSIDLLYDNTKDRFGIQGITKYTCFGIQLDDNYLHFVQCVDGTKDGNEYGFEILRKHD